MSVYFAEFFWREMVFWRMRNFAIFSWNFFFEFPDEFFSIKKPSFYWDRQSDNAEIFFLENVLIFWNGQYHFLLFEFFIIFLSWNFFFVTLGTHSSVHFFIWKMGQIFGSFLRDFYAIGNFQLSWNILIVSWVSFRLQMDEGWCQKSQKIL